MTHIEKPCPFCGWTDLKIAKIKHRWFVQCNTCRTDGPVAEAGGEEHAWRLWNSRHEVAVDSLPKYQS